MESVTLTIDGQVVSAAKGSNILEAARAAGIEIPALCFLKDCNKIGACRMCMVSVKGAPRPVAACMYPVAEGMEVVTQSEELNDMRRRTLDLICSDHRMDCEFCERYSDCELHAMMRQLGMDERKYALRYKAPARDERDAGIVYDSSKCILCRRCVAACSMQGMNILQVYGRGEDAHIGMNRALENTACIQCGQCISVCPTGALTEQDELHIALHVLEDPDRYTVAIVSPEVCKTLGELFSEKPGTDNSGKVVSMLHKLGFRKVVDSRCGRSLAAAELAQELSACEGPLFTSDCPASARYCRMKPALCGRLSGVASPDTLLAKALRSTLAEEAEGRQVYVIDFTACVAEKYGNDIDLVMTTRQLALLIKRACVSRYTAVHTWKRLCDEPFDAFGGAEPSGSDDLIVEALSLAGASDAGEGVYVLNGRRLRTITVQGMGQLQNLAADDYDVIRVLACPDGCIGGGGQPHVFSADWGFRPMAAIRSGRENVEGGA